MLLDCGMFHRTCVCDQVQNICTWALLRFLFFGCGMRIEI